MTYKMSPQLVDENELKPYQEENLHLEISKLIENMKSNFETIPSELKISVNNIAKDIKIKWREENNEFKKENQDESPEERLVRWKSMTRKHRQLALLQLADIWYGKLRNIRGEIVLIGALYEYSEIEKILNSQDKWKLEILENFDSIVLRMKGPRKPSKKNFTLSDLKYDISKAFLEMMKPLLRWSVKTQKKIEKIVFAEENMNDEFKLKRYQEIVITREYVTLLCQALAPRAEGIKILKGWSKL